MEMKFNLVKEILASVEIFCILCIDWLRTNFLEHINYTILEYFAPTIRNYNILSAVSNFTNFFSNYNSCVAHYSLE